MPRQLHRVGPGDDDADGHVRVVGQAEAVLAAIDQVEIETTAFGDRRQACRHIVIGAHGEGGLGKRLLGSIVAQVLETTALPVTVVR